MQLTSIVATALLPLLAAAQGTSTTTATMTMTKYITIAKAATTTTYAANSTTSFYMPTGSGGYTASTLPTTSTSGTPTTAAPTVSPTIDNNGAGSLTAFGFAGVAGMIVAALL
ncbi:hypothetical protein GGR57DRAFT_222603 [Xylariaceae sp. FL1272]|nr:hypothetical protein GGR57DRAFT_222603 [Xylariaceae sp. FL1272]